jgi:uncharacterized membrane protein
MVQELVKYMTDIVAKHPGKVLGAAIGLIIGLLVIALGVFRTIFLIACIVGGLYVGARIDEADDTQLHPLRFKFRNDDR